MRYLVYQSICFILFLVVASTLVDSYHSIRNTGCNKRERSSKSSIFPWLKQSSPLQCGQHIVRTGRRSTKHSGKNRIAYGTPVYPGQFPYHVRIETRFTVLPRGVFKKVPHRCGGVIITEHLILTTASCLGPRDMDEGGDVSYDKVVIGGFSLAEENYGGREIEISDTIFYPGYNKEGQYTKNNLAFIYVREPMRFDLHQDTNGYGTVNSVCLPTKDVEYEPDTPSKRETWLLAGWGDNENNNQMATLSYYEVHLTDYSYCKIKDKTFHPDDLFCTFDKEKKSNVGDQGSGVVRVLPDGRYELVGIQVGGTGGDVMGPDYHINIFNRMDWINKCIQKYSSQHYSKEMEELESYLW